MKKIFLVVCTLLLLAGCAKNETIIYGWVPDSNGSNNENPQEDNVLITFSATLENRNITRSLSPMPKGVISQVYSYKANDYKFGEPFADGLYVTSSAGMLTGVEGYKMYLTNGKYNMYALSNNSSSNPPEIKNGETSPLQNGIDYLWWENIGQDVTTSQVHIPIIFRHVACQVVLEISAGKEMKLDSVISASILPPSPGATLSIRTGLIESTKTYDTTPLEMGVNKSLAQAIVLPTISTSPMPLELKILADGETTARTYSGNIPIPGKLAGGFSYVFSVIIDGNSISFSDASIKDWTDVDETGTPIYPKQ